MYSRNASLVSFACALILGRERERKRPRKQRGLVEEKRKIHLEKHNHA